MTENSHARLSQQLAAYDKRMFDFRVWWVREYEKLWGFSTRENPGPGSFSPANWFNYVTKREVWNPTGGMREWLYTKKAP